MPYLVICLYRPGGADARLPIRDRHLEYLIEREAMLAYGGAIASDDGESAIGMFLALRVESRADADAFMASEPYCAAGLFSSVSCQRLRQFVPHPEPDFLRRELERERARLGRGRGA